MGNGDGKDKGRSGGELAVGSSTESLQATANGTGTFSVFGKEEQLYAVESHQFFKY